MKEAVFIPLIGNGDMQANACGYQRMLDDTVVDAVMIGLCFRQPVEALPDRSLF